MAGPTALIGGFVQVVVAMLLVIGFFLLAFFIYNKDAIEAATVKRSVKVKTYIFRGIKDLDIANNETYDTSDRTHPTFREMPNSINQHGGAEFSYSFWMYKAEKTTTVPVLEAVVNDKLVNDDLLLLVRGSNRLQNFKNVCNKEPQSSANVMVKCPLIKFQGQRWEYLVVELNTSQNPDGVREQAVNKCNVTRSAGWGSVNAHKLALGGFDDANFIEKWFNVAVVISDTEPTDNLPVRNKVRVRIYVNGVLEMDRYVDNRLGEVTSENPSVLLQNHGPLHVAPTPVSFTRSGINVTQVTRANPKPTGTNPPLFMANLVYMSYAASPEEIKNLYKDGFDKNIAPSVNQSTISADRYRASVENLSTTSGEPQLKSF
jgi:hypothetical protein